MEPSRQRNLTNEWDDYTMTKCYVCRLPFSDTVYKVQGRDLCNPCFSQHVIDKLAIADRGIIQ